MKRPLWLAAGLVLVAGLAHGACASGPPRPVPSPPESSRTDPAVGPGLPAPVRDAIPTPRLSFDAADVSRADAVDHADPLDARFRAFLVSAPPVAVPLNQLGKLLQTMVGEGSGLFNAYGHAATNATDPVRSLVARYRGARSLERVAALLAVTPAPTGIPPEDVSGFRVELKRRAAGIAARAHDQFVALILSAEAAPKSPPWLVGAAAAGARRTSDIR